MDSVTAKNLKYILRISHQNNASISVYYGVGTLLDCLFPMAAIIFPKLILDELAGAAHIPTLLWILVSMFLVFSLSNFFSPFFQNKGLTQLMSTVFGLMRMHTQNNMQTNFSNIEDPNYLNRSAEVRRCLQSTNEGFQGAYRFLFLTIGAGLSLIVSMVILSFLSIPLLLFLLVTSITFYLMSIKTKNYEMRRKEILPSFYTRLEHYFSNMQDAENAKDIRIFKLQNLFTNNYQKTFNEKQKIKKSILVKFIQLDFFDFLFILIREGGAYAYCAYLYINQELSIGNLVLYLSLITSFSSYFKNFMENLSLCSAQNDKLSLLREEIPLEQKVEKIQIEKDSCEQRKMVGPLELEFKQVYFRYPGIETFALENVSFKMKAGEKIAIVGTNGSGKSTLVKLMLNLYRPTSGTILLDGVDLQDIEKAAYWEKWSSVFQETNLLAFSVYENVAIQNSEDFRSLNRAWKSLRLSNLEEKILGLPHGIHTNLSKQVDEKGVELSGGEAQKLLLARALYRPSHMFTLDEPTAALDALAEFDMYRNFDQVTDQKSVGFISHRLSSTRFCDRILFVQDRRVIEEGTHQELLALKGAYFDMYEMQARFYR